MRKERNHYTGVENVAILRRHLLDKVPVSNWSRLPPPKAPAQGVSGENFPGCGQESLLYMLHNPDPQCGPGFKELDV